MFVISVRAILSLLVPAPKEPSYAKGHFGSIKKGDDININILPALWRHEMQIRKERIMCKVNICYVW
jgi:hypothetical protein